ncbi:MAG: methyltransferase domain-containing protein [Armatimonadota bacterium]
MIEISPDKQQMREFIYSLLDLYHAEAILDIGCGSGGDLLQIGKRITKNVRLVGIDSMATGITEAKIRTGDDPRFEFIVADAAKGLKFPDETFDLVVSTNMLECVVDTDALLREVHRVLKPGGQVVFAHYDWDSQLFDGSDKALVRKIVQAYNDWQQAWMTDCDAWMGRRLWRTINRTGLFSGSVYTHVLINTEFSEPNYGYARAQDFQALVKRRLITRGEYDRFYSDLTDLAARGEYFYSITMYAYAGRKIAL